MKQCQIIQELQAEQLKKEVPQFSVGDTVAVHMRIVEGEKERTQVFTGVVIGRTGSGLSENFTLYRVAYGSAMERVFPLHSPKVGKVEIIKRGKVRLSKLHYLRGLFGKKTKIQERIVKHEAEVVAAVAESSSDKAE